MAVKLWFHQMLAIGMDAHGKSKKKRGHRISNGLDRQNSEEYRGAPRPQHRKLRVVEEDAKYAKYAVCHRQSESCAIPRDVLTTGPICKRLSGHRHALWRERAYSVGRIAVYERQRARPRYRCRAQPLEPKAPTARSSQTVSYHIHNSGWLVAGLYMLCDG